MKDMKKVDDIFREGLDKQGLTFADAHWQDMEALIENKKEKKKPFAYWATAILLIGFGSFAVYYFSQDNAKNRTTTTHIEINNKNTDEPIIAENKQKILKTEKLENNTPQKTIESVVERLNVQKIFEYPKPNNPKLSNISIENEVNHALDINPEKQSNITQIAIKPNWEDTFQSIFPVAKNLSLLPSFKPFLADNTKIELSKKLAIKPFPTPWSLYFAPFVAANTYNPIKNSNVISLLKSAEQPINSYGYGIDLLAKKRAWVIKTGLNLQSFKEKTNYQIDRQKWDYDTSFKVVNFNYRQSSTGGRIALIEKKIDSTATNYQESVCNNCIASMQYINIPLALQYELRKGKFTAFAESGIQAGFLLNARGYYTDYDNTTGFFSIVNQSKQKNHLQKTILQANAALGLKYRFNNINIYGSYGIARSTNSMMQNYKQSINYSQVRLGLEFGF